MRTIQKIIQVVKKDKFMSFLFVLFLFHIKKYIYFNLPRKERKASKDIKKMEECKNRDRHYFVKLFLLYRKRLFSSQSFLDSKQEKKVSKSLLFYPASYILRLTHPNGLPLIPLIDEDRR